MWMVAFHNDTKRQWVEVVAAPWSKSWRGQKRRVGGFFLPQSKSWGGRFIGERSEPKIFLDVPPIFLCVPPILGGTYRKIGGGTSKECFRILYTINYQFSLPKQLTTWRHTYNPVHPMQPYGIREGRL